MVKFKSRSKLGQRRINVLRFIYGWITFSKVFYSYFFVTKLFRNVCYFPCLKVVLALEQLLDG
jgi:hypothetical protein